MFGLGAQELLIILIVVMFIFGGKRLPEIGTAFGRSIKEFKKATKKKQKNDISTWVKSAPDSPEDPDAEGKPPPKSGSLEDNSSASGSLPGSLAAGMEEVQKLQETAGKIKAARRFLFRR